MLKRLAPRARRWRGISLVECCVALAVMGVLAAAALPSQLASLQRARRVDAVAALTRLQAVQENHRAQHGHYGTTLPALGGAGRALSDEGHYRLSIEPAEGGVVVLVARAREDGPQAGDTACPVLTVRMNKGLADAGPDARCWNR